MSDRPEGQGAAERQGEGSVVDPRNPPADGGSLSGRFAARRVLANAVDTATRSIGEVSDVRESSARGIALIITWTFTLSAVAILGGIFWVLSKHPENAETLLMKAGIPALKEAGTFLSSVFGPLLAFVLGYYFGERKSKGT